MEEFVEKAGKPVVSPREEAASKFHSEKFLASLDHEVLHAILDELLEKSDIPLTPDKSVPHAIESEPSRTASGWHKSGAVTINSAKFDFNNDLRKTFRRLLSTYIHEYTHAKASGKADEETGFKYRSPEGKIVNAPINDGFTELIADYVYEEYVRRVGETSRLGQKTPRRTIRGYIEERADAKALVEKIAKDAGVPFDVALGAYIRAYFSNDTASFEETLKDPVQ